MNKLETARLTINEVDEKIAELFEKRMMAVEDVVSYKKEHQLPVFDEKREEVILETCTQRMKQAKYVESYRELIQSMMDISKRYQRKILSKDVVAYPGVEGAFSHSAAMKQFPSADLVHYMTFSEVVMAVTQDQAQYGVLPFENSYTGEVGEVMDLLEKHDVSIIDVLDLPIDQNLLVVKGATLSDVKQVYSHAQGLAQCSKYLNGRNLELIPYSNTALAAKHVSECQDVSKAAIASKATAQYYDLTILEEQINNSQSNTTRFIVISKTPKTIGNRFAMMFVVEHHTGALAKVIELIAKYEYNMENIKSRSLKERPWEYYFFIEVVGNLEDEKAKQMIEELKTYCERFKIVGAYTK